MTNKCKECEDLSKEHGRDMYCPSCLSKAVKKDESTNEQILEKAIEKALKNGWNELEMWSDSIEVSVDKTKRNRKRIWITYEEGDGECINLFDLIFSHEFAKAFFGTDCYLCDTLITHDGCFPTYKYHLQQMVIEPDPIQYLAKFLD